MRELEKPVARVFRRLRFQRFLTTLVWSWAIALVDRGRGDRRARSCSIAPCPARTGCRSRWPAGWACWSRRAFAAGHPARAGWTPRSPSTGSFHLNERLSSALTLPDDLRETPAGRALIADAIRKVADLDVAAEFGLRLPRRAWVVLIPAAVAVLLLFVPGLGAQERPGQDQPSRSTPRRWPSRPRSSPRRSPASARRSTRRSSPRPTSCWPRSRRSPTTWPRPPRRPRTSSWSS